MPSRNWSHGLQGFFRFPSFVPVHLGTTHNLTLWGTRFTNPYSGVERLVGHQRDRDISRSGHARYSRTARVVTWLLPASKRDPYAAGEARSHGCACVTERSPACPYHAMIDYITILVEKFGETFNVLSRSLPLFPDGFGNTLTKSQVVSS